MSKGNGLMQKAQVEKTKQTIEQLIHWYQSKQNFFKTYLPIQQSLVKKIFAASELTVSRLKEIAQVVRDERELQQIIFEKTQKNTLSNQALFHPACQEVSDQKGSKIKVELPAWSSNIDRIFIGLSQQQQSKQSNMKNMLKMLEQIQQSIRKEEDKYKGQIKKNEKEVDNLFNKFDDSEQEASKIVVKLIKQNKNQPIKEADFFIAELKKLQCAVLKELAIFAERGLKLSECLQVIVKLEKDVARKVKEQMGHFLNYRKTFLGIGTKDEEEIWGKVALCEDKVQIERVSYFNKVLLKDGQIEVLKKLMPDFEPKNNWQVIVKFLNIPKEVYSVLTQTQKSMFSFLKNISYRCWTMIALAQGWLIESYIPSVMYMTYDHIMVIYSKEGTFLKKISTTSSKINKIEGDTLFLQQKIKGFFSDSVEEYKIRFEETERMEEFQLFMENQIK